MGDYFSIKHQERLNQINDKNKHSITNTSLKLAKLPGHTASQLATSSVR